MRKLRVKKDRKLEKQIPPDLRNDLEALQKTNTRMDLLDKAMYVDQDLRLMLNTGEISYELDEYVRDTYFSLLEDSKNNPKEVFC